MGLDNIWMAPPRVTLRPIIFNPPLRLAVGTLAAPDTFRGKVYDELVCHVSGVTLYRDYIPNRIVRWMSWRLGGFATRALPQRTRELIDRGVPTIHGTPIEHVPDLVRMFRARAEAGYSLLGWW